MISMSVPVTPKKNVRAFGGSDAAASSEWYDSKVPNCIDFDKPSMCIVVFIEKLTIMLMSLCSPNI